MRTTEATSREIGDLVSRWAEAVVRCDLDGVLAAHADDVVMFDVPEPQRGVRGIAAYAASWPPFFEWIRTGAHFEIDELEIEAGESTAYAWALLRCGTDDDLTASPDRRLRVTFGLRRDDPGWRIAHEHHSFPQA